MTQISNDKTMYQTDENKKGRQVGDHDALEPVITCFEKHCMSDVERFEQVMTKNPSKCVKDGFVANNFKNGCCLDS